MSRGARSDARLATAAAPEHALRTGLGTGVSAPHAAGDEVSMPRTREVRGFAHGVLPSSLRGVRVARPSTRN
ncbi:MAG: hypothetical protein WDN30_02620 [Pararobbsia sp.]